MRKREVAIVFLLLFITMAILTIPLWWNHAQPYIFGIPDYIRDVMRRTKDFINLALSLIKQRLLLLPFVTSIYCQSNFSQGIE